tara:strand:- start:149367 stop:150665 length:1299 start_codon:yes stop_codon:yes gene_type:complete
MSDNDFVIVGGGQAAAQIADELRRRGCDKPVSLYTGEPLLPYQRPPLSKQFLSGQYAPEWLLYRSAAFYEQRDIQVHTGKPVIAIHRDTSQIELADGSLHGYQKLALATGARVRKLTVPGAEHAHYIRSFSDIEGIQARLGNAQRVTIVGGGFIGLEAAASLRRRGYEVTLLVMQDRVLQRLVAPEVSAALTRMHAREGVTIVTGETVCGIEQRATGDFRVECESGNYVDADILIAGIGVTPEVSLAQQAGLNVGDGIIVDQYAVSSDANIVAAGDCTSHPSPLVGRRLRLETVQNAVEQAKVAAASLCGERIPYEQIPWVWSDQYQCRLQGVGQVAGYDQTLLRGDVDRLAFSVFYFRDQRLLGMHAINSAADFAATRLLMNRRLAPSYAQLKDPAWRLQEAAQPSSGPSQVVRFDQRWPDYNPVSSGLTA